MEYKILLSILPRDITNDILLNKDIVSCITVSDSELS